MINVASVFQKQIWAKHLCVFLKYSVLYIMVKFLPVMRPYSTLYTFIFFKNTVGWMVEWLFDLQSHLLHSKLVFFWSKLQCVGWLNGCLTYRAIFCTLNLFSFYQNYSVLDGGWLSDMVPFYNTVKKYSQNLKLHSLETEAVM